MGSEKLHAQMLYGDTPLSGCTFVGAGVTADFRDWDGLLSPRCGLQDRRSLQRQGCLPSVEVRAYF